MPLYAGALFLQLLRLPRKLNSHLQAALIFNSNYQQYVGVYTSCTALYVPESIKHFAYCVTIGICYARYMFGHWAITSTIIILKTQVFPVHLTLVLCARVCFLGALVFQESFGQNIMLNTETSIYKENISKYSNPSWNAENSSFPITDNSLCLSYMLINFFYISRVFQLEENLYPTYNTHGNKKSWTGVNNLFK